MEKEEIAFRIVELYLKEVADTKEKRRMGLDTIMSAYFYCLLRLMRKEKEVEALSKAVEKEERALEEKEMVKPEETLPEAKSQEEPEEEFEFD